MSFPKGNIWQSCREDCLEPIPVDVALGFLKNWSLQDWRDKGGYTVSAITTKLITLDVSIEDFVQALFSDVEKLLDHMAEHRAAIFSAANGGANPSPAWLLVTVYYWSFFGALAWLRLIGSVPLYLDKDAVSKIVSMGASGSKTPGGGSFFLKLGAQSAASRRPLNLKKKAGQVHDAIWRELETDMLARATTHGNSAANQLEVRLFHCMFEPRWLEGPVWPSSLRNVVNYRPGFAYEAKTTADTKVDVGGLIRSLKFGKIDDLVEKYEGESLHVTAGTSIFDELRISTRLLLLRSIMLDEMCQRLYQEVSAARKVDKRSERRRLSYLERHGLVIQGKLWPWHKQ